MAQKPAVKNAPSIRVIAGLCSITFDDFARAPERERPVELGFSPFYCHPIGRPLPWGMALATEPEYQFRRCGGSFPPCTYLVAAQISSIQIENGAGRLRYRLWLESQPPVSVVLSEGERFMKVCSLRPGDRLVGIGDLSLVPDLKIVVLDPSIRVKPAGDLPYRSVVPTTSTGKVDAVPVESSIQRARPITITRAVSVHILDMRPESRTFGRRIKWSWADPLPHDPDVLSFPSVFVTLSLNLSEPWPDTGSGQ